MIMGGNFITARHPQAKNEGTIFEGVSRENGDFRSLGQRGRCWSPFYVTRVDWHFHIMAKANAINRRDMITSFFGEASSCAGGEPSQPPKSDRDADLGLTKLE
jgi:hypothetical protein